MYAILIEAELLGLHPGLSATELLHLPGGAHVDQVIGDNAQSDPAPHAVLAAITASVQSVPPFENTDPAFIRRASADVG
jgi:hypothetical protein